MYSTICYTKQTRLTTNDSRDPQEDSQQLEGGIGAELSSWSYDFSRELIMSDTSQADLMISITLNGHS